MRRVKAEAKEALVLNIRNVTRVEVYMNIASHEIQAQRNPCLYINDIYNFYLKKKKKKKNVSFFKKEDLISVINLLSSLIVKNS